MSKWASDMKDANNLFTTFIDEIAGKLQGKLVSTELEGGKLAEIFDTYAGIDAVHVWRGNVRGVAVRVQWGKNYKTFTIRYKRHTGAPTEYHKRIAAIKGANGALYPYLTIQAYADKRNGGRLLGYAVAKTAGMYEYIEKRLSEGGYWEQAHTNICPEGNTFLWVSFDELIEAGVHCIVCDLESNSLHIVRQKAA